MDPQMQAHTEKLASGQRIITHLVANGEDPLAFVQLVKHASTDPNMLPFADDVAYALVYAIQNDGQAAQKIATVLGRSAQNVDQYSRKLAQQNPALAQAALQKQANAATEAAPGIASRAWNYLKGIPEAARGAYQGGVETANNLGGPLGYAEGLKMLGTDPLGALGYAGRAHPLALAGGVGAAGLAAGGAAGVGGQQLYDQANPFGATMRNFGF